MSSKIKNRPTYTEDFKRQIVSLHSHGKRKVDLVREYGISPAALDRWVKQYNQTGGSVAKFPSLHFYCKMKEKAIEEL
ncbi:transposase [Lactococcus garvieae]|uniref:transposase n=1 Tax=Lactococcus garvieae TaxID=1363 RepID=UPI00385340B7